MKQNVPMRRLQSVTSRASLLLTTTHDWLLNTSLAVGFGVGLLVTVFHDAIVPPHYELDAKKIWSIASGAWPDFRDQSFTPVAMAYRALGLGDAPLAAGLFGYLLTAAVIFLATLRLGRLSATWPLALLILAAFILAGVYLGQYSKDVFVLPVVALLLLPHRPWWDLLPIAAMVAYAYWFRDYWYLVAVAYCAVRLLTLHQVRLRYLLLAGALGAVAVGLAFHFVLDRDPNHFRTVVQGHLEANTLIPPIEPFPQPFGGLIDVFVNYWLILAPVTLPFVAAPLYIVIAAALAFVRFVPLVAIRSAVQWPPVSSLAGTLLRRGLALMIAFAALQAVFEPDYGSVIRHLTPLLPIGITVVVAARHGIRREGTTDRWNWSGATTAPDMPR